jgi:hypothetical protein
MCMNCGCGEVDKRHQPTDITRDDLQKAADGAGITLREAARNVKEASEGLAGGQAGGSVAWSTAKRA